MSQEKMARKPKAFSVGPFTAVVGFSRKKRTKKTMRLPANLLCNFGVKQQCKLRRRCATKAYHLCEPDRCHISHHMPPVISSRRAAIICTSATYSLSTCVFYLSAGTQKGTCAIVQHMHVCLLVTFPSNERMSLER